MNDKWQRVDKKADIDNYKLDNCDICQVWAKKSDNIVETYVLSKNIELDKYRIQYNRHKFDPTKTEILKRIISNKFKNVNISIKSGRLTLDYSEKRTESFRLDEFNIIDTFDNRETAKNNLLDLLSY